MEKTLATVQEITDKQFVIKNHKSGEEIRIEPKAVESCMVPNSFHITPVRMTKTTNSICLEVGDRQWLFLKEDIDVGNIEIVEISFEPKVIRKKNGCSPCTNCGQCSW